MALRHLELPHCVPVLIGCPNVVLDALSPLLELAPRPCTVSMAANVGSQSRSSPVFVRVVFGSPGFYTSLHLHETGFSVENHRTCSKAC